jgi:hypothetical protein
VIAELVAAPLEEAQPAPVNAGVSPSSKLQSERSRPPHGRKPKEPRDERPRETQISAPSDAPAELKIHVLPYGDVWIDGKRLGQAPVTAKLPAGVHEIGVGDGRPREKRSVTLSAGESTSLEIHRKDVENVE